MQVTRGRETFITKITFEWLVCNHFVVRLTYLMTPAITRLARCLATVFIWMWLLLHSGDIFLKWTHGPGVACHDDPRPCGWLNCFLESWRASCFVDWWWAEQCPSVNIRDTPSTNLLGQMSTVWGLDPVLGDKQVLYNNRSKRSYRSPGKLIGEF